MNYKIYIFVKLCLLVAALGVALFLLPHERSHQLTLDSTLVFVLDINSTMNIQDVVSGSSYVSRIDAAKHIVYTLVDSRAADKYGLVVFASSAVEYIVPPTHDTSTLLLYLSGIVSNYLPQGSKDTTIFSWLLRDVSGMSYVLLSDSDGSRYTYNDLPDSLSFVRLWSLTGVADSLDVYWSSVFVSDLSDHSYYDVLDFGYVLPYTQRIFLYMLLGVLVILALLL